MNDDDRGGRAVPRRVPVRDEVAAWFADRVVGRTITGIDRHGDARRGGGEDSVTVTLDDGARFYFVGWVYDASGVGIHYEPGPSRYPG